LAHEVDDRPTAAEFQQQLDGYLSGQTAAQRALVFPDGDAAGGRAELLSLAVKHWSYAAGILHDGTLAHWLRWTLHDTVAAQAAEAAVLQWPDSPDAALDAFIGQLDSSVRPSGAMELRTTSLRRPGLGPGQHVTDRIEIANTGKGHLRGELLSTQPWIKVGATFDCPPGRACAVPIEIDTTGLAPDQAHLGAVTLTPVGGTPEVVAVQVGVVAQSAVQIRKTPEARTIDISRKRVDFGSVDSKALSTDRIGLTVTNVSQTTAEVRVQGVPRWLLVKPERFRLMPGAKQVVKLVGRVDKVRGRKQKVAITFAVAGGRNQQLEVRLEVKRRGLFG
jgi:hypothetical protein